MPLISELLARKKKIPRLLLQVRQRICNFKSQSVLPDSVSRIAGCYTDPLNHRRRARLPHLFTNLGCRQTFSFQSHFASSQMCVHQNSHETERGGLRPAPVPPENSQMLNWQPGEDRFCSRIPCFVGWGGCRGTPPCHDEDSCCHLWC